MSIMLKIVLLVCLTIEIQANTFKPNGFISRIMTKLSGEPTVSRELPYRFTEINNYIDYNDPSLGTFTQKLIVYDEFYKAGGPIFFLISARADFYAYWLENSIPTEIVQEKSGAIYALEPRYYGDSRPTLATSTSDLQKYFTLEHLITDYVVLINTFKTYFDETYGSTKVILYGYDTGATFATWIYDFFPNLIDGVWASSAPMYPSASFPAYFSDVAATIRNINPICYDHLEEAFAEIKSLIAIYRGEEISNYFNIGNVISTLDINDVNLFYYALLTGIGSIVEYANDNVVIEFCAVLEKVTPDQSLEALGNFFREFFDGELLTYSNLVNHLRPDTWDSACVINGERQHLFQSCSYLSWFRTSTDSLSFFKVNLPLEFYTQLCKDVFGIPYEDVIKGNEFTAAKYKLGSSLRNIYFTNGALDPYRQVGVSNKINTDTSIDLIMNVGKAYDFQKINKDLDSHEVFNVKYKVKTKLESWISK